MQIGAYKGNQINNKVKFQSASSIRDLLIPAAALGTLFYEADKRKHHEQAKYLGNTISLTILSVMLQGIKRISPMAYPGLIATLVTMNTLGEKTSYGKYKSAVKDLSFIGCGLFFQKFFTSNLFRSNRGFIPKSVMNICSFATGALTVAPAVNSFIMNKFVNPNYPEDAKRAEEIEHEEKFFEPYSEHGGAGH